MNTMTGRYEITRFYARDLIFKRCPDCKGFIVPAQIDACGKGMYYCAQCPKELEEDIRANYSFNLELTNIATQETLSVGLFDTVAEKFVGCTANDMLKLYNQDVDFYKKIESVTVGQFVEAKITKVGKKGTLKITSIQRIEPNAPPLYPALDRVTTKKLHYDPSLIL